MHKLHFSYALLNYIFSDFNLSLVNDQVNMKRDFTSISPSAKMLLLTKGLTNIPFISDAASIICGAEQLNEFKSMPFDETFLKRLIHFESRYLSLDSILSASGSLNILEISSGFSFRGLNMALHHPNIFYLDTDLPAVVEDKIQVMNVLTQKDNLILKGKLKIQALNALDGSAFSEAMQLMPAGPVSIINEGLLMYLNLEEKKQLCQIIHHELKKRKGYWITADVYIKKDLYENRISDSFNQFLSEHHVEENKFQSFEAAENFFGEQGFKLVKKATSVWHQLSAVKYVDPELLKKWVVQNKNIGHIRETWALKAI